MVDEKVYTSLLREILTAVDNQFGSGLGPVERMNIALTILQEIAKDRRMQQIHDERGARAPGQQKLKSWRDDPVTPDQLKFLQNNKIPFMPGITKGEASDLIDAQVKKWQGKG